MAVFLRIIRILLRTVFLFYTIHHRYIYRDGGESFYFYFSISEMEGLVRIVSMIVSRCTNMGIDDVFIFQYLHPEPTLTFFTQPQDTFKKFIFSFPESL